MLSIFVFFFFNDTATTEIYTLSLHDALPILIGFFLMARWIVNSKYGRVLQAIRDAESRVMFSGYDPLAYKLSIWTLSADRKSTRLNSSHANISYAVFCLKKKKLKQITLSPAN